MSQFSYSQSSGKMIPSYQYTNMPRMKHESVIIPSTSAPAWGGYFVFDIREKNARIHDVILQFNVSALTGYTVATGSPTFLQRYTPAVYWFTRIELVQSNNIIDTIYPDQQFVLQQLFNPDERRTMLNVAQGSYSSIAQRVTMASTANTYYVDLSTHFSQTHQGLYSNKDDIQIRVYMDSLSNNAVGPSGGTFTLSANSPISTINSSNVIVKLSRESNDVAQAHMNMIKSRPVSYPFTELRYGTFNVNSGTQSANIVLTSITGKVAFLVFSVRSTTSLSGENFWNYLPITNFSILDSSSANIVGGQSIPSTLNLLILDNNWVKSSYVTEIAGSTSTNNNAYVYGYSFSADPYETIQSGSFLNCHTFNGSEQLQILFPTVLASNVQVNVYAYVESYVEVSATNVRKTH